MYTLEERLSRENIIWAAGFLEGEGCFYINKRKHKAGSNKTYFAISIQAGQNQRSVECLEKLKFILGGNITGPYKNNKNKSKQNEMLMWSLSKQKDVYAACIMLYPFMSQRRKTKIEELIAGFKENKK